MPARLRCLLHRAFHLLPDTDGKPAGARCVQLDECNRCKLFGHPDRPAVCGGLQPQPEMCGDSREHALHYLRRLEQLTAGES